MTRRVVLVPAVVLACGVVWAAGAPAARQAAPPTPVLVELFTSEGCSSCPPADQLLIDLAGRQPVPGARIVALGEHVDYWDRLGWKDPFSDAAFTARQSAYAAALHADDVYTPQLIIDGRVALVGSDRVKAIAAIRSAAGRPKPSIGVTWTGSDHAAVTIAVAGAPAESGARVRLAVAEDGLSSEVRRGENEGRTLSHAAVTRQLLDVGAVDGSGSFNRTVRLALDRRWRREALHVVVFVQRDLRDVVAIASLDVK